LLRQRARRGRYHDDPKTSQFEFRGEFHNLSLYPAPRRFQEGL
jgi:hypothetical protein